MGETVAKPTLAVWKFSSCDGCQLSILDLEEELLDIVGAVEIAYFPEMTRAVAQGPYDVSLVEGSVTTPEEMERIAEIRENSKILITLGACAVAGGIQALRNFDGADAQAWVPTIYAHPEYISTLSTSTAISDHIDIQGSVQGCPPNKYHLLELIGSLVWGRTPNLPTHSQCLDCKAKGNVCVLVAHGTPCLGPVTRAGCGSVCPSYHRGCYGCHGPAESPNMDALTARWRSLGVADDDIVRGRRMFYAWDPGFVGHGEEHHKQPATEFIQGQGSI